MWFLPKKILALFYCLIAVAVSPPTPSSSSSTRELYDSYLQIFKKKETPHSFFIFSDNLNRIRHLTETRQYYLTQDSDSIPGHYYESNTVFIYLLDSRKKENQKVLLCV